MAKKIKKHIIKSMPVFVILSLVISTLTLGIGFNFNFDKLLYKNARQGLFSPEEVKAQNDTASTTVTVKNAAPTFTTEPAESPASTSTSPVNVGYSLTFTATANDVEGNDYYLIVCDSDSVSATNGGAPTCGGTQFCVSSQTSSDSQATCVYSSVADPGAETDEWYAFVCDNHATEADCSSASQGANPGVGDDSSPFYVNHAPVFTAVITSDDNKDPGGTFTVTASTTDSDVEGGADVLSLYVCNTLGWATSTGCTGDQLCMGTSTSPNISCSFATSTPAADGSYTYYAYVKDWHEMPATGNYRSSTYTVNNVAPTVGAVTLNGGSDITLNMRGMDEVIATTTSVSIQDNNGCADIDHATGTVYWSNATGANNCSADDDDCYQIAQTACTMVSSSCSGSGDATVTYNCVTTMAYHAIPTDNSTGNPNSGTNWLAAITVFDDNGESGTGTTSSGVDVITTTALEVTETEIPYGSIKSGQDSGDRNATTTIVNYGNSPLDTDVSGTDMNRNAGGDLIPVNNQEYNLSNFTYGSGTDLSSTTPATVDVVASKPTTAQPDVSDQIFWGIGVPGGTLSGDYTGTNTFTAALDSSDW